MTRGRAELGAARRSRTRSRSSPAASRCPDNEVRIVDELGREVGERVEGRLEFRGPSQTSGYFRNEAKSRELFHDGWLDTRRPRLHGGRRRLHHRPGQGHHHPRRPQHLSRTSWRRRSASSPACARAASRCSAPPIAATGTERLVVLAETRETDAAAREALQARAARGRGRHPRRAGRRDRAGAAAHGAQDVERQGAPQLRQGAVRARPARREAERVLAADAAPRRSPASARSRAPRPRMVAQLLYAAWWWIVLVLVCAIGWLLVLILPRLQWRWAAVRNLSRFVLLRHRHSALGEGHRARAARQRDAAVQPRELHGPAGARRGAARRAGLRRQEGVRQPARRRLADAPAGRAVRRALRPRRRPRRHRDGDRARARGARSIVFFPEGTFTRRPGLSDFFLGAFKVASDAGLPVDPGVIRGTRTMLRGDQWLPRWTPINDRDRRADQAGRHRLLVGAASCATRRAPRCWRAAASPTSAS